MILLPPHLFKQYRSCCADSGVNGNEFADLGINDLQKQLKVVQHKIDQL